MRVRIRVSLGARAIGYWLPFRPEALAPLCSHRRRLRVRVRVRVRVALRVRVRDRVRVRVRVRIRVRIRVRVRVSVREEPLLSLRCSEGTRS